jgi:hypothetical protein
LSGSIRPGRTVRRAARVPRDLTQRFAPHVWSIERLGGFTDGLALYLHPVRYRLAEKLQNSTHRRDVGCADWRP